MADHCSLPNGAPLKPHRIPKIVHFIFGLDKNFGNHDFGFIHYLAIRTAKLAIKPEILYLHYFYESKSPWWEKVKPLVTLKKLKSIPTSIFGNPVNDVAHRADVVRLEILLEYGGIYLDSDMFVFKSIDNLLHNPAVMGRQDVQGLCNAMILAEKNSSFIQRWYQNYKTFDDKVWDYHSVVLPEKLAILDSSDICVAPNSSFFWPSFYSNHVSFIHEQDEYVFNNGFQVKPLIFLFSLSISLSLNFF